MTQAAVAVRITEGIQLRFEFVGMLFALTMAEIAIQFADIVATGLPFQTALPAYSHLVLALLLVSMSWVAWSTSSAPGAQSDSKGIFTFAYLVLLLDVLLVVFYFILVKGVDIVKAPNVPATVNPSLRVEATWLTIIFGGYVAWDVLTRAVFKPAGDHTSLMERLTGRAFWERGWMSAACLCLMWGVSIFVGDLSTPNKVILGDVVMISLIVLFRALRDMRKSRSAVYLTIASAVTFLLSSYAVTR
jgi:hypothetical protein